MHIDIAYRFRVPEVSAELDGQLDHVSTQSPVASGGIYSLVDDWMNQGREMKDYVLTKPQEVDIDYILRPRVRHVHIISIFL